MTEKNVAQRIKLALLGGSLAVLIGGADARAAEPAGEGDERAVTFSGCVAPGRTISHRVNLPGGRAFLHRVTPDRRGFNVIMTIDYPGLNRRVNNAGPGRPESFTVRTPFGPVSGRVRISGLRGSFGCYVLRVTP